MIVKHCFSSRLCLSPTPSTRSGCFPPPTSAKGLPGRPPGPSSLAPRQVNSTGPSVGGRSLHSSLFFRGFPQDTLPAIPESLWYSVVSYLWLRLKKKVRDTTCKFKLLPAQKPMIRRICCSFSLDTIIMRQDLKFAASSADIIHRSKNHQRGENHRIEACQCSRLLRLVPLHLRRSYSGVRSSGSQRLRPWRSAGSPA